MGRLAQKVVCITGASSGIGRACARLFAGEGARLVLCARRQSRLEELAIELEAAHGTQSLIRALDVRSCDEVKSGLGGLPPEWQAVEVLVNNAGLALGKDSVQQGDMAMWEQMVDTNLKGMLYVTRVLLPGMLRRNVGHIINLGSIAGREVYSGGSVYCATKHAERAFSQGLRHDLLGSAVRVSSVDPGFVETEFSLVRFDGDQSKAAEVYRGMTPLTPEDVADAIFYCVTRPAHVNVSEILLMPTDQASITAICRRG